MNDLHILKALSRLNDSDAEVTEMEHAFIQTALSLGRIPPHFQPQIDAILERYKEEL